MAFAPDLIPWALTKWKKGNCESLCDANNTSNYN